MIKNRTFIVGGIAGASIAAAAMAAAGLQWPGAHAQTPAAQAQLTPARGPVVFSPPPGAPMSFADIIDRVSPAVVSIETRSQVTADALRRIPGLENFPFDSQPNQNGEQPTDPDNEQLGAGSGFFISQDGYIVTNNHVVEGASSITVTLKDERELPARVVGRDENTDLAVLKVEGSNFPYVEFEAGAKPRVGDWVIAVGNPFGLGGTATAGIVSAYGRNVGDAYVDYLQIDAPINRGNSGGPTFDIYGRVIGVNSAIFSPNGVSAGIGFAIPSDVAEQITKQLIRGGKVERGYLGVTIGGITPEIAESLNLATRAGAYITEVNPGGPADRGGLEVGDVVVRMNGQPVKDNTDLTRRVGMVGANQTISLDVLRNGRPVSLQVRSGLRPSEAELAARARGANDNTPGESRGSSSPIPSGTPFIGGLSVAPLDGALRQRLGVPAGVTGLVVTDVLRGSAAARNDIPLRPGDVILRVDNQPVATVGQAQGVVSRLRSANRPSTLLLMQRQGQNFATPMALTPTPAPAPTPTPSRPSSSSGAGKSPGTTVEKRK
ncbi:MAG: Do family serine endopeptidase [Caulobacteraceae bacterium]|nr:Do family serine endopeptidase [Caulobacteraceae bacterium]